MDNETMIAINNETSAFCISSPLYHIILFSESVKFMIDLVEFESSEFSVVFLSPYQYFQLATNPNLTVTLLSFHGDFYCIEYHKKEVACNGILFNNIYEIPFIELSSIEFQEISSIMSKINLLDGLHESYEISLKKAYLQLILALCSKQKQLKNLNSIHLISTELQEFKELIENNFIQHRNVSFYAEKFNLSIDVFSKKVKMIYGKPPSVLIKERLILEAKKLIHLTYKNINEIAFELGFSDEFHFSKYFKKEVGVSPKYFREKVGISIVAK